jgi:hypothetical protein
MPQMLFGRAITSQVRISYPNDSHGRYAAPRSNGGVKSNKNLKKRSRSTVLFLAL